MPGTMYIFFHMVNKCERNQYSELYAISTQSSQFSKRWCQSAQLSVLGWEKEKNLHSRFESRFVNSEIYRIRTKYTNKKIVYNLKIYKGALTSIEIVSMINHNES